ncbi:ROK family protein [[Eubacterium] hominis]|uniref:ROK family protein n=1 Tax=[Eubacterium] hominis TaxID=2764325 RepID=UPI003A4D9EF1
MKTYIGVDLGGTNVRVAKVDENGNILQIVKEPTEVGKGVQHVVDKIIKLIESIDGYQECEGIGMGVPGPVDTVEGKMVLATNLPGFEGFPIAKTISDHFHIPTFVDNDVNVAGMGEAMLGAGKGLPIVYYVTISTGIGGALIVNERVVAGKNGHAGEVANIIIDRNREKVNYLNVGAVENEASGTAITRKGKEIFGDDAIQHAGDVFDLARKGDEKAIALCDQVAYDIAVMFSAIAHVVDPYVFVVGGGVMKGKDVFFDKMEAYYRTMIHKGMQTVEFKEALLEEPGIVGAAMLPRSYVDKENI